MKFKNVTIAGGGTLGSQIAWQTAFNGFEVTVEHRVNKIKNINIDAGLISQAEQLKFLHDKYLYLFINPLSII